jgi:hypothetical protein
MKKSLLKKPETNSLTYDNVFCDYCGQPMQLISVWPTVKKRKGYSYYACVPGCLNTKKVFQQKDLPEPVIELDVHREVY